MKKLFAAAALLLATVAQAQAPAAESNWEVRFRAVQAIFQHKADPIDVATLHIPKDDTYVSNKVLPEVDISYLVNQYLSAELILTYPQRLDVYASSVRVGTVDVLPPCLTLQGRYPIGPITPYIGAGANLTLFTAQNVAVPAGVLGTDAVKLKVNNATFGFVGQAGFDLAVPGVPVTLNVDVKYVTMQNDVKVKASGAKITTITYNPILIGAGVAYKF
jgi:outer membrane protein